MNEDGKSIVPKFDRDELAHIEQLRTNIKPNRQGEGGGQPTKLTPKVQEALLGALAAGCYVETAVAYVGISKQSFYEWLRQGAQDRANGEKTKYAKFSDAIGQAMSEFEVKMLTYVGEAAKSQDAAARWMLERKFPKRWGQPGARVEVTGKDGGQIESRTEHTVTPESLALASAIAGALERLSVPVHPEQAERSGGAGQDHRAEPEAPGVQQ